MSQLADQGDFFASDVAGEPFIIVRGRDDGIRAFANVCRRRGSGQAHRLRRSLRWMVLGCCPSARGLAAGRAPTARRLAI